MARHARILLPVFVTLSLFADSASAACAWVLWNEITVAVDAKVVHQQWQLIGSFPTHDECATKQKLFGGAYGGAVPVTPDMPSLPPGVAGPANVARSFQCHPDTIDPRGPKGK